MNKFDKVAEVNYKNKTVRLLFVTAKDPYVGLSFHLFL